MIYTKKGRKNTEVSSQQLISVFLFCQIDLELCLTHVAFNQTST